MRTFSRSRESRPRPCAWAVVTATHPLPPPHIPLASPPPRLKPEWKPGAPGPSLLRGAGLGPASLRSMEACSARSCMLAAKQTGPSPWPPPSTPAGSWYRAWKSPWASGEQCVLYFDGKMVRNLKTGSDHHDLRFASDLCSCGLGAFFKHLTPLKSAGHTGTVCTRCWGPVC